MAVSDWSPCTAVKIDDAGGMIEPHYVSHLSAFGSATDCVPRHRGTIHRVACSPLRLLKEQEESALFGSHCCGVRANGTRDVTADVHSVRSRPGSHDRVTEEYRNSAL